jgi:short-subunit dehydrogenase
MKIEMMRVVLTGASGGIGAATARALDAAGAKLLLAGRDGAALERLCGGLRNSGHAWAAVDIGTPTGRAQLLAAGGRFGANVLVNNAGIGSLGLLEQSSDAELARIVDINLLAPMLLCRDFIPLLRRRDAAAIVNVGSILGSIGYAGSTAYCASKFGLRGFTEALRRELADSAIELIYFAPRATATALNSSAMQALNDELGNAVDAPDAVAAKLVAALRQPGRDHLLGWPEAFFARLNALFPAVVGNALRRQLATIRRYATIHTHEERP